MLCFVINKTKYEDIVNNNAIKNSALLDNAVCVGSVPEVIDACNFSHLFPCLTEVRVHKFVNTCLFILCNP